MREQSVHKSVPSREITRKKFQRKSDHLFPPALKTSERTSVGAWKSRTHACAMRRAPLCEKDAAAKRAAPRASRTTGAHEIHGRALPPSKNTQRKHPPFPSFKIFGEAARLTGAVAAFQMRRHVTLDAAGVVEVFRPVITRRSPPRHWAGPNCRCCFSGCDRT